MLVIMENVRSHCLATITAFTWSPLNINTLLLFKTIVCYFSSVMCNWKKTPLTAKTVFHLTGS